MLLEEALISLELNRGESNKSKSVLIYILLYYDFMNHNLKNCTFLQINNSMKSVKEDRGNDEKRIIRLHHRQ